MNIRTLLAGSLQATTALGLVLAATAVAHAGNPMPPAPEPIVGYEPVAPGNGWTGFYITAGVGAGGLVHELDSTIFGGVGLNGIGAEGVLGEIGVGYDHMIGQRGLIGLRATYRRSNIETELSAPGFGPGINGDITADWGFDLIGRAGLFTTPETLVYALGGFTRQNFDLSTNVGFGGEETQNGFVVGAGVETAISPNISLRGEYRYHQFKTEDFGLGGLLDIQPSMHTFTLGASYRFGKGVDPVPAPRIEGYSFQGFSVSLAGGAGVVNHELSTPAFGGVSFDGLGGEGVFGELGVGYDHMLGQAFFAGLHGALRYGMVETSLDTPAGDADLTAELGGDIYVRAGFVTAPGTAIYALGGVTRQRFELDTDFGFSTDETVDGFLLGAGLETALSRHTALRVEYRYADYEKEEFLGGALGVEPSTHTVRAALAYRF